jgi:hypothetical protein
MQETQTTPNQTPTDVAAPAVDPRVQDVADAKFISTSAAQEWVAASDSDVVVKGAEPAAPVVEQVAATQQAVEQLAASTSPVAEVATQTSPDQAMVPSASELSESEQVVAASGAIAEEVKPGEKATPEQVGEEAL